MTKENYNTATRILKEIEKLKETQERVNKKVSINSEGQNIDRYFDRDTFTDGVKTEINTQIRELTAQFDAL